MRVGMQGSYINFHTERARGHLHVHSPTILLIEEHSCSCRSSTHSNIDSALTLFFVHRWQVTKAGWSYTQKLIVKRSPHWLARRISFSPRGYMRPLRACGCSLSAKVIYLRRHRIGAAYARWRHPMPACVLFKFFFLSQWSRIGS